MTHALILGVRSYLLHSGVDLEELKKSIVSVATSCGGYVATRLADGERLSLLVASATAVATKEVGPVNLDESESEAKTFKN